MTFLQPLMQELRIARLSAIALASAMAMTPALAQEAPQAPRPAQAPRPQAPRPAQPAPAQPQPAQPQPAPAAQQQPAPEPVAPRQITGTTTGWVKICQKIDGTDKEGCMISQEVRAENGAFLTSMAIQEIVGEQRRQLIVAVPLGMALQAGLLMRVDQERAIPAKFGTCLVNGCFAGIDLGNDLLTEMKKGQNIFVTVRNAQGIALDLTLPLASFPKVFDGPATDLKVVEEQQNRLQAELLRKAEEARQRLLEQQGQTQQQQPNGTTPPAPAPQQ